MDVPVELLKQASVEPGQWRAQTLVPQGPQPDAPSVVHGGSDVLVVELVLVDVDELVVVGSVGAALTSAETASSICASTAAASPVTAQPPLASIFANVTANFPLTFAMQPASTVAPLAAAFT